MMDAPIMLLFFNRPHVLKKTFEWVRHVKPRQLFLAQDGPREGYPDDEKKIAQCREIVSHIDWECEVHKNYSEKNLSCDEREFSAISWCFEYVDRLIILEDDCMPAYSFYGLCAELLERYQDDARIHMISGFNRCGKYKNYPYDYLFSQTCAGLGWATWRRVWEEICSLKDADCWENRLLSVYEGIIDADALKIYKGILKQAPSKRRADRLENKVHSWEFWVGLAMILNNRLAINSTKNMVCYLGLCEGATHSADREELVIKRVRRVLTQPAYEMEEPIKHPPFMVRDRLFEQADYDIFWKGNSFLDRIESLALKIKYRRFDLIADSVRKFLVKK